MYRYRLFFKLCHATKYLYFGCLVVCVQICLKLLCARVLHLNHTSNIKLTQFGKHLGKLTRFPYLVPFPTFLLPQGQYLLSYTHLPCSHFTGCKCFNLLSQSGAQLSFFFSTYGNIKVKYVVW